MTDIRPAEKAVGTLIASGLSNREIAEQLGLAVNTVENHRTSLFRMLGIHNSVQLTHYAIAHGWVKVQGGRGRPRKDADA